MHLLPPLDPGDRTPRIFRLTFPLESVWSVSMATHGLEAHHLHPEDAEQTVQFPGDSRAKSGAVMLPFNFDASELFAREKLIY